MDSGQESPLRNKPTRGAGSGQHSRDCDLAKVGDLAVAREHSDPGSNLKEASWRDQD